MNSFCWFKKIHQQNDFLSFLPSAYYMCLRVCLSYTYIYMNTIALKKIIILFPFLSSRYTHIHTYIYIYIYIYMHASTTFLYYDHVEEKSHLTDPMKWINNMTLSVDWFFFCFFHFSSTSNSICIYWYAREYWEKKTRKVILLIDFNWISKMSLFGIFLLLCIYINCMCKRI
jgi:hypothetical protein